MIIINTKNNIKKLTAGHQYLYKSLLCHNSKSKSECDLKLKCDREIQNLLNYRQRLGINLIYTEYDIEYDNADKIWIIKSSKINYDDDIEYQNILEKYNDKLNNNI
jgi:hypothetical protein